MFELLGDVTLHSTFPENEVELARTRALSALALQLSQPGAVAQRFFESEIYGRNPYGRSATRDSYRAVTRDDVTQFARQRLQPVGALLVVAGDVTDAQVRDLVGKAFAGWRGASPPSPALPAPATRVATDLLLVHRPGSAQANIALGNTTLVVWSGDPFEFTTGVEHVLIRGKEIPLKSRQTELLERYKKLPPSY